jgi:hypothetical protein
MLRRGRLCSPSPSSRLRCFGLLGGFEIGEFFRHRPLQALETAERQGPRDGVDDFLDRVPAEIEQRAVAALDLALQLCVLSPQFLVLAHLRFGFGFPFGGLRGVVGDLMSRVVSALERGGVVDTKTR